MSTDSSRCHPIRELLMSIFRASNSDHTRKHHGSRVVTDPGGFFDFESEVLQDDEYAWSWGMAHAFREAFEKRFEKRVTLTAKYTTGILGRCRHYGQGFHVVEMRPTLRGSEAWRTYFHELAHALTCPDAEQHGQEWREKLVAVHEFWKEFLKTVGGELKDRLIEMVTNYAYWRGRPIGMDENTDPWNRPWVKR